MTLKHLQIFVTVFNNMSVTKAAAELYMTQPAVSRAIQEIEAYYGLTLFDRINKRLSATEAGKAFYTYAIHITDSFDLMDRELRDWDELGVLKLGTSITIGTFLLPAVLHEIRSLHPHLKIRASIANGYSLEQALIHDQLDFAVIEGTVTDPQLCSEVIASDHLVPILPPDSPLKGKKVLLEDLLKEPLLLREKGSAGRSFLDSILASRFFTAEPLLESVSTQALVKSVALGLGISFLPESLVAGDIASGSVCTCELSDVSLERNYSLVWHRHKLLSRSAREAMDLFKTF